jgi:hypothetical protein
MRQGLLRTLDIQTYRVKQPLSHLQEDVEAARAGVNLIGQASDAE